jgi:restriction endonuclease S subunit
MNALYKGVGIKNISKTNIEDIKIPIPSLTCQHEIIQYLDFIYEKTIKTSNEKIVELKQMNLFCLNNQKLFGKNTIQKLGEICTFLPKSKRNAKFGNLEGTYPFFKSSLKVDRFVNEPDYEEESLIIGDGGEPNINYGLKFSASDHCYILQNKNKSLLLLKYVYYYLYHNLDIMNALYKGVGIKNISKTNIEDIKIPIPSLDYQKEIIDYCNYNETLIQHLENEINNNKILAQQFILNIIKFHGRINIDEQTETCSI